MKTYQLISSTTKKTADKTLCACLLSFIFAFTVFCPTPLSAQVPEESAAEETDTETLNKEILQLGLPVVFVDTKDEEEPTFDIAEKPVGCLGDAITNATKVQCRVRIQENGKTVYDSGNYIEDVRGATVRVRGNSSAGDPKKPYKLKLQKKADLLRRGDSRFADKDWLLMRTDRLSLNALVGLKMNERVGLQWTPQMEFVNLFFNDDYKGIYMITESVKRNADCRLNVDKETGYIIEFDPYYWNEDVYVESLFGNGFFNYTFKHPEDDKITEEQLDYAQTFLTAVETSITEGTYEELIDVESFVNWLVAHDILGTQDGAGSNMFMTKYDSSDTTKLCMANLWDFDTVFESPTGWASIRYSDDFYIKRLIYNTNTNFFYEYLSRYDELEPIIYDEMIAFVDSFATSATGQALSRSWHYDLARWNAADQTFDEEVERVKEWFSQRKDWMRAAVDYQEKKIGISTPKAETIQDNILYDLTGRRINLPARGVFLKGRQKVLKVR